MGRDKKKDDDDDSSDVSMSVILCFKQQAINYTIVDIQLGY